MLHLTPSAGGKKRTNFRDTVCEIREESHAKGMKKPADRDCEK